MSTITYICINANCAKFEESWQAMFDTSDARATGWSGPADDNDAFCSACGEQGEVL